MYCMQTEIDTVMNVSHVIVRCTYIHKHIILLLYYVFIIYYCKYRRTRFKIFFFVCDFCSHHSYNNIILVCRYTICTVRYQQPNSINTSIYTYIMCWTYYYLLLISMYNWRFNTVYILMG